jgi:hypothetical protein
MTDMFKNYLVTSWRNILKSKGFSFLNIAGLAVGLAVCLLIMIYVRAETSYDAYHEHVDRIYRIQNAWLNPDGSIRGSSPLSRRPSPTFSATISRRSSAWPGPGTRAARSSRPATGPSPKSVSSSPNRRSSTS